MLKIVAIHEQVVTMTSHWHPGATVGFSSNVYGGLHPPGPKRLEPENGGPIGKGDSY